MMVSPTVANRIEFLFFIGGACFCLLVFLMETVLAPMGILVFPAIVDSAGIYLGVLFSVVNFRSWKVFVSIALQRAAEKVNRQPSTSFFITLKITLIVAVFFILSTKGKEFSMSFLLGFTGYLFAGMFLTLLSRQAVMLLMQNEQVS